MYFRKIYDKTHDIINNKKIIFLIGPRQVGKTTFLKRIFSELETSNKQFLNLENFEYHTLFKSFSLLERFIVSTYDGKGRYFLFLDEFQKVKGIDTMLKLIYDEMPFVKVILSGSNNIEINKKIKESFAGRKRVYYMRPLDFDEFLIWKKDLALKDVLDYKNNPLHKQEIQYLLEEFMTFGGYPEVVLATSREEKKQVLHDIFDFWFNRDIILYTQKMYEFKELVKQLSFVNGSMVNYARLAGLVHLSAPTIKAFIEVLKETFVVFTLRPFFNNKRKEINKSPKLYFMDVGFRNYFINRFDFSPTEYGVLFENVLLSNFIKQGYTYDALKFRRTNDEKYEVDLVLELEKKVYEFKYKERVGEKDMRGLTKFLEKHAFQAQLVSKNNFFSLV